MPNHCEKKSCEQKCKRFDSWSESKSSCDSPKKKYYERKVILTEVMCKQNDCRRKCKKSGYKVKCENSWHSIECPPRVECEKKVCEKKCAKPVCKKVCEKKRHH